MFLELCCNLCVQGLKHRCFVFAGGLFHLLDADENGVVSYSEMMQQIKSPAELQLILTMLDELHLCAAVDHDQPTCPTSESGRTVQVRTLICCCAISEARPLRVQHNHARIAYNHVHVRCCSLLSQRWSTQFSNSWQC